MKRDQNNAIAKMGTGSGAKRRCLSPFSRLGSGQAPRRCSGQAPRRCSGQAAFTLVELIVVIVIIVLLASIAAPTASRYRRAARNGASLAAVRHIQGACVLYKADFDELPPSSGGGPYSGWQGCELVVLFLTGYGPDEGQDGTPGGDLKTDDGHEGFGFRLEHRGRAFPPYNETHKMDMAGGDTTRGHPYFVDAFGNPICYYRYDNGYDADDNKGEPGDGPANIAAYAQDGEGQYYRKDLVLCSQGDNKKWNPPSQTGDNDDITNFFFK